MESTKEQSGMLHQILPPRLEDAGLEDPALPPESIHQAFLQAAAAVKSRAATILSLTADTDEDHDHGCVNDPWPTAKDAADAVVGIDSENEPQPGSCTVERGVEPVADEVKVGGGGDGAHDVVVEGGVKLGEEDVEPCVDELQGLDIKDDVKKGGEDDEENEKPTLVEGYA
ncbi:uncharacterized protein LOC109809461 [Cajanus cajan]|uniref:Uncharacterized protein n=1 Tax=Cajanus cajan TaxID=3821 RepID=A0A151SHJ5_CAJCA|nr:uncharacterized protein LOC109809461 [Cajanus cajan]KYP54191.1 hypothetical protein KK1_000366 [Cajanus cajan]